MSVSNTWEADGLCRKSSVTVSAKEIWGTSLHLHGDPQFDKIKYVLNDFTLIEGHQIGDVDINEIVTIDKVASISKPVLKIAIVTTLESFLELALVYREKWKARLIGVRFLTAWKKRMPG